MAIIKIRWTVSELENVMSQFDVQKVYRATVGPDGPWAEITGPGTRVALVGGQTSYYYDDAGGASTYYYAVAYYNSGTAAEGSKSAAIRGDYSGVEYLTIQDLYNLVGERTVQQYFDDDLDLQLGNNNSPIYQILAAAEAEAASRMLRGWTTDQITELAARDRAFRSHVAWVALEFASQRRPEFCTATGGGAWAVPYDRAIAFFDSLSKGKTRSVGEPNAGVNRQTGGMIQPTNSPPFVFTPDSNNPTGHGGF